MISDLFFDLIQVALGNKDELRYVPSKKEWEQLYDIACRQSLDSVLLDGVNRLKNANPELNINQCLLL